LTYPDGGRVKKQDLRLLLRYLRKITDLEYLAVRTGEGNGVYHICLVSAYIDQALIREKWELLTGAYRVNISRERSIHHLVNEMTKQKAVARYSKSQGFVPIGTQQALNALAYHFTGRLRLLAYSQFAARCRLFKGDCDKAFTVTMDCCNHSIIGLCSDLKTRLVYNLCITNHG